MRQMAAWLQSGTPTVIGGDFNVIPEDIDCDKPENWKRDALFQPEPRDRYRAMLSMGYTDTFRSLYPGVGGQFTYWDYFRQAFERSVHPPFPDARQHTTGRVQGGEHGPRPQRERNHPGRTQYSVYRSMMAIQS